MYIHKLPEITFGGKAMEKNIFGKNIKIFIDDTEYTLDQETITGSELRNTAKLDSCAELWQTIAGPDNDKFVETFDIIKIQNGDRFITGRKTICPCK